MTSKEIIIRLYKDYTSKYLKKILIAGFFSILVAGSTSVVAYLLDPAIKRIFVDRDQTLIYLIPILLALSNTLLSRYHLTKEKQTNKQEVTPFGVFLLVIIPSYAIFVFWYSGLGVGFYTIIIFIVTHYIFEKIFKLPNDARFKKK